MFSLCFNSPWLWSHQVRRYAQEGMQLFQMSVWTFCRINVITPGIDLPTVEFALAREMGSRHHTSRFPPSRSIKTLLLWWHLWLWQGRVSNLCWASGWTGYERWDSLMPLDASDPCNFIRECGSVSRDGPFCQENRYPQIQHLDPWKYLPRVPPPDPAGEFAGSDVVYVSNFSCRWAAWILLFSLLSSAKG